MNDIFDRMNEVELTAELRGLGTDAARSLARRITGAALVRRPLDRLLDEARCLLRSAR